MAEYTRLTRTETNKGCVCEYCEGCIIAGDLFLDEVNYTLICQTCWEER